MKRKRKPGHTINKLISEILGVVLLIWVLFRVELFTSITTGEKITFIEYLLSLLDTVNVLF